MNKTSTLLMIAAFSGALVVGLGAVGSHALESILEARGRTGTWDTAVRYHAIHTLAILSFGILNHLIRSGIIIKGINVMLAGMVMFSGSLYILSLSRTAWFAYITPIGGILLILSWILLFYGIFRARQTINNPE